MNAASSIDAWADRVARQDRKHVAVAQAMRETIEDIIDLLDQAEANFDRAAYEVVLDRVQHLIASRRIDPRRTPDYGDGQPTGVIHKIVRCA